MKPISMLMIWNRMSPAKSPALMSHTGSTPTIAAPSRLPSAPMPKAVSIETTPTPRATASFAPMIRPRCGTSVNDVSPVRWLHSLVTDRIAIIGRMIAIGMPIAAPNES